MSTCCDCQKPKAQLECGVCKASVCKVCAHVLREDHFSFLPKVPEILTRGVYCGSCFEQNVEPSLTDYDATMERAREVLVFFNDQGKETRLIRRTEKPLRIASCADREETLLRLAFLAAKAGYNAVVDIELTGKKIR